MFPHCCVPSQRPRLPDPPVPPPPSARMIKTGVRQQTMASENEIVIEINALVEDAGVFQQVMDVNTCSSC